MERTTNALPIDVSTHFSSITMYPVEFTIVNLTFMHPIRECKAGLHR